MSTTIDERVVSMQFDNKQFESNVQTSLSTLDKLKQSLNFNGASKGLENVSAAAKNVNFSGLSGAVETVRMKFSALEVMAVTALANITNSAVNAGKRVVSAFTLDPIKTGMAEYETQIGAIQTILANTQSKGSTMQDVNSALDELNKYADKTIYNFTEMTRNIGTFTAAGVDLEKSVTSIKGIANLAAISGSTSQQASTAMYQLSQALASGTVKLQDWNSVVNAGMGGEVFQTALKRTASQMGYNVDAMIEKYGSFRESLTQGGWLTAEVLTETLTQLSGAYNEADLLAKGYSEKQAKEILELADTAESAATDVKTFTQLMDTLKESAQSGWTQTWEILIGDFEEAKALWTSVSNVFGGIINASAEARNKLLGGALSKSTWGEFTKRINEAGVSTERFQESVRSTAQKQGVDIDAIIDKYGDFEHAVKAGAISTDLLKKGLDGVNKKASEFNLENIGRSLKKGISGDDVKEVEKALESLGYKLTGKDGKNYADDGYFGSLTEEAIKEFQKANNLKITGLVDEATLKALDEATKKTKKLDESVYALIDGFGNLGGREKLIEGFSNAFDGLKNIIKPIKDAFRDIFPPATADQLYKIVEGFSRFTADFEAWTVSAEGKAVISDIAAAFKGFFSVVDIGWTLVKNLTSGIVSLIGSLLGFGGGIAGIAGSIGEWLTGLRNSVKESNIFGTVINGIVGILQNGIDAIKAFFSFIGGNLKTAGWEGFQALLSGIWNFIQKIGGMVSRFGTAIGNIFMGGGFGEIISLANGGLFAMLLLNVSKFFKGITKAGESSGGLFESIKDALEGVGDLLSNVGEALTAWTQNIKANILLKIAGAIGILAVALMLIASIQPDKLSSALTAITVLFGELMLSLNLFSKTGIGEMKGVSKAVTAMIGISTAVLILAVALKKIASLGWEELAKGLVGIITLTGTMVLAAKALSSGGKQVMKGATQMIILAGAVKILASVCRELSQLSWEELAKGLVGVGVLLAEISIFMRTAKFDGKSIMAATGILILSGAIKILASACSDFASMSWDEVGKGLASIGALLLELAIFAKLTGNAKNIVSTGIALVAIGAAMKIFASAITDLAALSWSQLGVGLVGIAGSLLAVSLATKLMPKNLVATGIGLVAVGAALLIVADALTTMGGTSWDSVARSLVTLGGSMLILAVGLNLMKGTLGGSAALLVASAALAVLTPVLKTLGEMSWGSIVKGLVAIAGSFVILGVAGAVLGPLIPAILGLAGALALVGVGMLAVGVGVLALGAGIAALATGIAVGGTAIVSGITSIIIAIINLIPDAAKALGRGIVEFCKAIADSADAIGEAFTTVLLALVDVFVDCVPALVEGLLVMIDELLKSLAAHTPSIVESVVKVLFGILEGVAAALKNIDGNILLDGLLGVGVIAAIIAALAAIAPLVPGALIGALGMGVIVAELAIVLAAIGALAQIPGLQWLVGEGGQFMQSIGSALGKFVGGLVGGVAEGFTASLPQIGTDLSTFMTNLKPFLDGAAGIDKSVVDGVGSIVDIIIKLTAANVLDSLTSWFTGGSSLTAFGTELVSFGASLASFSSSVSGVDAASVSAAVTAAQNLISVASTIPNSGGIISWFAGDNDMGAFGSQLKSFGTGIKDFSDAVTGVNAEGVTSAANAAKSLVDIASTIPSSGGIVSWFTGSQDLTTFSSQLGSFGAGIKSFATEVTGINTEAVSTAATAASTLITAAAGIPSTGGIVSWFTGDQDLSSFGKQLKSFGTGIKDFSNAVVGIDTAAVTTASTVASDLSALASGLPEAKSINNMKTLGEKAKDMGKKLKEFADEVAGITWTNVTSANTELNSLATTLAAMPTSFAGATSFASALEDISETSIDDFVTAFTDAESKVISAGEKLIGYAVTGVNNNKADISTALTAAVSTAAKAISTPGGSIDNGFRSAGRFAVVGFTKGVGGNLYLAKKAGLSIGKSALDGIREALDVNSPSKKFHEVGVFAGVGFINALRGYVGKTYSAGYDVGEAAQFGLRSAISKVRSTIENDIDTQPTIRPVLDLSNVTAGAGTLSRMLDMRSSVGVASRFGTINSMMNNRQNGGNDDVISAIKDLGNKLDNVSGDTYQVGGITYDDGSNITEAVRSLAHAVKLERRL